MIIQTQSPPLWIQAFAGMTEVTIGTKRVTTLRGWFTIGALKT